jgi:hypothetical protein
MARHEHKIATVHLRLPAEGREDSRRGRAAGSQKGDPPSRSRRGRGVVDPHGRIWRAGAAQCHRCETEASIPLEHVRRPRDTPIWKLEAALKCRSCRTPRYSPPVHMIRLTEQRQTAPYVWVHPDDNDR